jgi:hypothetical protein
LNRGPPRFECSFPGIVRTIEVDIDVGQDREQCDSIANTASSARKARELLRGGLPLAELDRAIGSDRTIVSRHSNIARRQAE